MHDARRGVRADVDAALARVAGGRRDARGGLASGAQEAAAAAQGS
jgi:hypothetical protein